ncbi:MAG: DUF2959 domain-containing protein [Planctomycetes bacterium]|nr:DUF2959 domain-containing protein [Planctomycetota bacterium]
MKPRLSAIVLSLASLVCASSCSSMYYGVRETFGSHKRDILVERVEEARDAQDDAKQEFSSALEAFKATTGFQGGELAGLYEKLNDHYDDSADAAEEVGERIEAIEDVSADLFEEWDDEIQEIQNLEYRSKSERLLTDTRSRCRQLVGAMRAAESKMKPVLVAFHDHVLFLKHNLNAQAIASLQGQLSTIESDVGVLIRDMEKSIAEADAFIEQMEGKQDG